MLSNERATVAPWRGPQVADLRYAVIALAVLAIAWPSIQPDAHAGLAGSTWHVVEIGGAAVSGAGTLRFSQTSVRGKAACNSFSARFHGNGDRIKIATVGSTRMYCDGRMDLEQRLFDALEKVSSYRIDAGRLLLIGRDGTPLVRLAG
ncbi:MAG: META domain-containing protein [Hyphomicrobiaceae bacterium]